MNQYVTGAMIKRLREKRAITQQQLAEKIGVSDKAISKWETGRGYPDITLIEPLACVLGVSVIELFSGENIVNANPSFNMRLMKVYVGPLCGNVVQSSGQAVVSCCGITLPALEAEPADESHPITVQKVEDEYYVTVSHDMTKTHYISFLIAVKDDGCELIKLYPEGAAEARFKMGKTKEIYAYCNRHGLYKELV